MQVIKHELRAVCDVDETLIQTGTSYKNYGDALSVLHSTGPDKCRMVSYYKDYKIVYPKYPTISFLKSLKERGYHITVQSNNGWEWAENVVKALHLEDYVDIVCTKSSKCIDDSRDFLHIMGTVIHPDELK